MNLVPPRFRGWRAHRQTEKALWQAIERTRVLPENGWQETSNGMLPPPYPAVYRPPFAFEVIPDSSTPYLYIAPGAVYAPWTSDTTVNVPRVHFYPVKPEIGGTSIFTSGTNRPSISLSTGNANYVFLKLTYTSYDYQLGGVDYDGAGDYGYEVPYSLQDSSTGSVSDATPNGSNPSYGIRHFVKEQNYYLASAEFVSQTSSTWPATETAGLYNIYAGVVTLDADGQITLLENLLQGAPIWAPAIPRHKDSSTNKTHSVRGMPEAPVTGGGNDPDIP